MCTVTYIPLKTGKQFVLTANRDERSHRATIAPEIYTINDISVCFPKDTKAGGSWIGMNSNGRIAVLLNGAFKSHTKMFFHTHSRGKVLLHLLASNNDALQYFDDQDLKNTEPFTIITIDLKNGLIDDFNEFIWDGKDNHYRELDIEREYIWSSTTLHSEDKRKLRRLWFSKFLLKNKKVLNPKSIYTFHTSRHAYDKSTDFLMEREDELKTVSITQIINDNKGLIMSYTDLITNTIHEQRLRTSTVKIKVLQ